MLLNVLIVLIIMKDFVLIQNVRNMKRKEKKKFKEIRRKQRRRKEMIDSIENHEMFYGPIEEKKKRRKYQTIVIEKLKND